MAKASNTVPTHIYRPNNVFWIYLGVGRYNLFMPKIPERFTLPIEQLKLLKNKI